MNVLQLSKQLFSVRDKHHDLWFILCLICPLGILTLLHMTVQIAVAVCHHKSTCNLHIKHIKFYKST